MNSRNVKMAAPCDASNGRSSDLRGARGIDRALRQLRGLGESNSRKIEIDFPDGLTRACVTFRESVGNLRIETDGRQE